MDLDPTNDVLPSQRHVTLAWGRDYGDVSPLRGVVLGGRDHTLHVGVSVTPAAEDDARVGRGWFRAAAGLNKRGASGDSNDCPCGRLITERML